MTRCSIAPASGYADLQQQAGQDQGGNDRVRTTPTDHMTATGWVPTTPDEPTSATEAPVRPTSCSAVEQMPVAMKQGVYAHAMQ
jgi:hypothetical protein